MMSSAEHWWIHLSSPQREFIQAYLLERTPNILLKDVQTEAFKKHATFGWHREHGFPESIMRII